MFLLQFLDEKQQYIMQIAQAQSREASLTFAWIRSKALLMLLEAARVERPRDIFTTRE
jgi:hypothetical protein